jgi:hypothetical protein
MWATGVLVIVHKRTLPVAKVTERKVEKFRNRLIIWVFAHIPIWQSQISPSWCGNLFSPTKGFICCTEFFVGHQHAKIWHKQKPWLRSFPGNCWKICWELTWMSSHSGRDTFYHTNSCLVDTRDGGSGLERTRFISIRKSGFWF